MRTLNWTGYELRFENQVLPASPNPIYTEKKVANGLSYNGIPLMNRVVEIDYDFENVKAIILNFWAEKSLIFALKKKFPDIQLFYSSGIIEYGDTYLVIQSLAFVF
jgi:hypothetical protein